MRLLLLNAGCSNKGAEMMALEAMRSLPGHFFTIADHDGSWNRLIVSGRVLDHPMKDTILKACIVPQPSLVDTLRGTTFYKAMEKADAVLDLGGYRYADELGVRNMVYLWRNVMLAHLKGARYYINTQSIGAIKKRLNRIVMGRALSGVDRVYVRGSLSAANVRSLHRECEVFPDTVFAAYSAETERASTVLMEPFVAIVPSTRMAWAGLDEDLYLDKLEGYAREAIDRDLGVLIMPHEFNEAETKLCQRLAERLENGTIKIATEDMSAPELRFILSRAEAVVTSRLHAAVNALGEGVPTAIIGWSKKYEEILQWFTYPMDEGLAGLLDPATKETVMEQAKEVREGSKGVFSKINADLKRDRRK